MMRLLHPANGVKTAKPSCFQDVTSGDVITMFPKFNFSSTYRYVWNFIVNYFCNYYWKLINLHCSVKSSVFHNGYCSTTFPVLQATRQGGVISPFMYLCSIDDLLDELNACGAGFKINGVKLASPTVCDDMLLLALSKFGLNILKLVTVIHVYGELNFLRRSVLW